MFIVALRALRSTMTVPLSLLLDVWGGPTSANGAGVVVSVMSHLVGEAGHGLDSNEKFLAPLPLLLVLCKNNRFLFGCSA